MRKPNSSSSEQIISKVLKMHDDDLRSLDESLTGKLSSMSINISETEEILTDLGFDIPKKSEQFSESSTLTAMVVDGWDSIAAKAEDRYPQIISIEDVFTREELLDNQAYMIGIRNQFQDLNRLDKWDYAAAGIVGTIAALMDFSLVTNVNLIDRTVTPGILKSGIEQLWDKILPPEKGALLGNEYKVSFDISTNTTKISQEVLGLNPKTHRFQSLGHDPILGFIFGIKDLMRGELTAIDGNGRMIIQSVNGVQTRTFIEAVITEFGHLLSDVNAASRTGMKLSIPAPFTPLLQLIHDGSISYKDKIYSVGDLSRRMYSDGYNFNHFVGMSIPVIIIHIAIRLYVVLREIFSETCHQTKHKLDILLFVANSILCAENVGKIVITENPFAINYVSWIDTARYSVRTLKYVLVDYHLEQIEYVQKIIDQEFENTYTTVERTWNNVCGDRLVVYL